MISIQVWATPTSGLLKSSSVKPTALNIARAGAREGPSTSTLEWRRRLLSAIGQPLHLYRSIKFDGTKSNAEGGLQSSGGKKEWGLGGTGFGRCVTASPQWRLRAAVMYKVGNPREARPGSS